MCMYHEKKSYFRCEARCRIGSPLKSYNFLDNNNNDRSFSPDNAPPAVGDDAPPPAGHETQHTAVERVGQERPSVESDLDIYQVVDI